MVPQEQLTLLEGPKVFLQLWVVGGGRDSKEGNHGGLVSGVIHIRIATCKHILLAMGVHRWGRGRRSQRTIKAHTGHHDTVNHFCVSQDQHRCKIMPSIPTCTRSLHITLGTAVFLNIMSCCLHRNTSNRCSMLVPS